MLPGESLYLCSALKLRIQASRNGRYSSRSNSYSGANLFPWIMFSPFFWSLNLFLCFCQLNYNLGFVQRFHCLIPAVFFWTTNTILPEVVILIWTVSVLINEKPNIWRISYKVLCLNHSSITKPWVFGAIWALFSLLYTACEVS